MATTETFTRDGKLTSTLIETIGLDGIVTHEWRFEPGQSMFAGGEGGATDINVRLANANWSDYVATDADTDKLLAAWAAICARPGFRSDTRFDQDQTRAFLRQTRNNGVLHATTRA